MSIAETICRAFCDELQVQPQPAGLAISTPFRGMDGDPIGFFAVERDGLWRLEDNGLTVPMLVASGVNVESGQRSLEFQRVLEETGVAYDDEAGELTSGWVDTERVAETAFAFVTCLIRLQDLFLLQPKRVASTFQDDAVAAIERTFHNRAAIARDAPILPETADLVADVVVTAEGRAPLGIFLATHDAKIWQAVAARTIAVYQMRLDCRIAALFEHERPKNISGKVKQQASNRLDASPSFRGDPAGAISRLDELMFGVAPKAAMPH